MSKTMLKRIAELEKVAHQLELSPQQRENTLQVIHRFASDFIDHLPEALVYSSSMPPEEVFKIEEKEKSIEKIKDIYARHVARHGINPASGGHLGYIPGGGVYAAAIADYLADVTNEYAGMFYSSPGATFIEQQCLSWIKDLFGFPESSTGNLCSGGSIANLIALTTARDKHQIKNERIHSSVIYLSEHVHHCVQKALRIIGLEDIIIRYIPLDDHHRMSAEILAIQIAKDKAHGFNPFCVIASAGTTDTGAIDPLKKIGKIANDNDLWYHIDGAYGGFFILVERLKPLFEGIELADSLCVDPHKGLFLPYGLGAVIIKDREAVYHSHHYRANYMQDAYLSGIPDNAADVSPELSKHFRGLRMWLPLQLHGIAPFRANLEEKILLTHYMRERLVDLGYDTGPEPDLSVSYFWWPYKNEDDNAFNKKLMEFIHQDGRVYFSSTVIDGRFVIRIAIVAFRTRKETIDKAIKVIEEAKEKTIDYFS